MKTKIDKRIGENNELSKLTNAAVQDILDSRAANAEHRKDARRLRRSGYTANDPVLAEVRYKVKITSVKYLAVKHGVCHQSISAVARGRTWRHTGTIS